jgi:DNA-binding SARP family transcriptional activator/TolB-like protein
VLRLTTFGGLALSRDGSPVPGVAAQRSRLSLLALLATAGPTGFSREKLLLYLWPESDEERARNALKQAVYSVRKDLGADEIIVGTAALSLNPALISSDVRDFEAAIASGDLAAAVALYGGPFLDGFHLKDSTEFERWADENRAHYAHQWTAAVERIATECEHRGEWRDAAGHWRKLASLEPLSGRRALALIRALAESGDLGAALQQFKIHEMLLEDELGSKPEAAVSAFAESLRNGTWTRSPDPVQSRPEPAAVPRTEVPTVPSLANTAANHRNTPTGRRSLSAARRWRKRSTAIAFVLGMLLVGALGLTWQYMRLDPDKRAILSLVRSRPQATLTPRQIVVAPFQNQTGDSTLDAFGEQIADWMSRELSDADFKVVDSRTTRYGTLVVENTPRPFRNRDENIALAEETNSAYAIVGKYYRANDTLIEVNLSVVDVATRQPKKSLGPFHGSRRNPDALITSLIQPTVNYLAVEVDTSAGGATTKFTAPPTLEAFKRVNVAWERFFATPGDTAPVFVELDSAAQLNPSWATPLLMKGYILDVKSVWPGVEGVVARTRPLVPQMSKLEKAAFELFESDLRGNAVARPALAAHLLSLTPGSGETPLLMVLSYLYLGDASDAVDALKRADPNRGINLIAPQYVEWSAQTYHSAGLTTAEEKAVGEERKRFANHPASTHGWIRLLAARNDPRLVSEIRKGMPETSELPADAVANRQNLALLAGTELRAHGHPTEATEVLQNLRTEFAATSMHDWLAAPTPALRRAARVYYEAGDFLNAVTLYEALAARDTMDLEAAGRLGAAAAHTNHMDIAKQADDRLARLSARYTMGAEYRWRATIAMAEGRRADAIRLLDQAIRRGSRLLDVPPNPVIHTDPEFVGIEKDPAYLEMLSTIAAAARAASGLTTHSP